jgi:CheY-like chemotaxis protein/predicted regulator of Ras-like GTPase activity (Roadblock/LC7/MglB family)
MVAPGTQQLVLIVDDEEAYRLSVADGLARYGEQFRTLTVADGPTALEVIAHENPSLVVSDIRMPRMDGIELLLTSRKLYPSVPFILVSAFFSESLERSARTFGAVRILHKPLDLDALVAAVFDVLRRKNDDKNTVSDGFLPAFSLPGFLQLVSMEQKTCCLNVRDNRGRLGTLWLEQGRLIDARYGNVRGADAALRLLSWDSPDITLQPYQRQGEQRIAEGLNFLLMESARLKDDLEGDDAPRRAEARRCLGLDEVVENVDDNWPEALELESRRIELERKEVKKEKSMSGMDDVLKKLQDISGFLAAGVFTPDGEMIASHASPGVSIAEIGALANDVLLKAQKATDIMNVGRGNFVAINAPRAVLLVRCLNENTDFTVTEAGRAHIHCALLLDPEGNVGLAKMQLEKAMQNLAPHAR